MANNDKFIEETLLFKYIKIFSKVNLTSSLHILKSTNILKHGGASEVG